MTKRLSGCSLCFRSDSLPSSTPCSTGSPILGLDQMFALGFIVADIVQRPYITVGFTGWLLLVPVSNYLKR